MVNLANNAEGYRCEMLKGDARLTRQLFITVDVVTTIISFILAYYLRRLLLTVVSFGSTTSLGEYSVTMLFIVLIWGASFNIQGAYVSQRFTSLGKEWKRIILTTVIGTLSLITAQYIFKLPDLPRSLILFFICISATGLMAEKALLYTLIQWLRRKGYNHKPTLIIGTGDMSRKFIRQVKNHPDWGLDIIGLLTIDSEEIEGIGDYKVIGTTDDFLHILHDSVIAEVIIALPIECLNEIQRLINSCHS